MSITAQFILRPVATSLLMAGVLLLGMVAYARLPIASLQSTPELKPRNTRGMKQRR